MKTTKRITALALTLCLLTGLCGCGKTGGVSNEEIFRDARVIRLDGVHAQLDGAAAEEFDYTWHCDPSAVHDQVKNAPAEYYTGTRPDTDAAVYIDSELYYYPLLEESGFRLVNYDGEQEWAYYYTAEGLENYIFATLPRWETRCPRR